jgi:hypothetical protein
MKVGERRYLISSKWWRKWCDYANFGENIEDAKVVNTDESHSKINFYEKPSKITNM